MSRKLSSSIINQIIDLALAGNPPAVIDRMLPGVGLHNIQNLISRKRRAGVPIPSFPAVRLKQRGGLPRTVLAEIDGIPCRERLSQAALLRGVTEKALVRKLLEAILADDMIDAILDDRHARQKREAA